jgi:hypothetical protein
MGVPMIIQVVSPKRFIWKGVHFKQQRVWMYALFIGFGLLVALNHFLYYIGYAVNEAPQADQILIQSVDRIFSRLNETYVTGEHLEIDATRIHPLIAYEDIPTIASIPGVREIYLANTVYIAAYYRGVASMNDLSFFVFSIPAVISRSQQISSFLSDPELFQLETGRLPLDGEREAAISYHLLSSHYHFETPGDAIGQPIEIHSYNYRIVGILFEDIAIVSYESNVSYGIYQYNETDYSDFQTKQLEFLETEQSHLNVDCLLVETMPGFERSVLNTLIQVYPDNNYVSNHFVNTFNDTHNRRFQISMWMTNIGVSVALAVIHALGIKSKFKTQSNRIIDHENDDLHSIGVRRTFLLQSLEYNLLLLAFGLVVSMCLGFLTHLNDIIVWNLVVSYAIIVLPEVIMLVKQPKHVRV